MAVATNVAQRRFVYGTNVIIQVGLLAVAVVAVVYFAQQARWQADLTRTGVNSLTPRTERLLRNLNQPVTITALYTVLSEYDERAQMRQDKVRDLLKLYDSIGGTQVTARLIDPMKERGRLPALLQQLRDKPAYRDQAQAHEAALKEYPALAQRLRTTVEDQLAETQRLLDEQPDLARGPAGDISQELRRLSRHLTDTDATITELQAGEIPQYAQAVETMRSLLETAQAYFQAVHDFVSNATAMQQVAPDAKALLSRLDAEYRELEPDINSLLERTADLESLELEIIYNQLNRWANAPPILIETEQKAEVLGFSEVWPFRRQPVPGQSDEREFAGEQTISSAILKLTQKEKTAVVFTRFGGPSPIVPDFSQMQQMNMRQLPQAPYGTLNELLLDANFITEDWDLATQKEPPTIEDAARTIYVVFPPTPPAQPDPRQPPQGPRISDDDIQIILDAVKAAGKAIFLAGCSAPLPPINGSGDYEFANYLRDNWGINVQHEQLVLQFVPSRENPDLYLPRRPVLILETQSEAVRFADHPISEPLRALPGGLFAACPVQVQTGEDAVTGVTADPLISVSDTSDIWAVADIMNVDRDLRSQRGTNRKPDDLPPPFDTAIAAENEQQQRLVVFGSTRFLSNPILDMAGGLTLSGGSLVTVPAYPANPDLFINALHWLTNNAERISVGAQTTEVPRLTSLEDGPVYAFWQVFLVGLYPGLALLIGGGVWLFRRR